MTESVIIGMGSNLGDRLANLRTAANALRQWPHAANWRFSPVYETPPVDLATGPGESPHAFLNAVAVADVDGSPREIMDGLAAIEQQAGRKNKGDRRSRPIDLDLLAVGEQVIAERATAHAEALIVPHEHLHRRWFVLRPLVDVAPDWIHPLLNRLARDLLLDLERAAGESPDAPSSIGRGERYAESLEPTK